MRSVLLAAGVALIQVAAQGPRDRVVDVSGTQLHLRCVGSRAAGQPLVVLEAGAFNTVDTWRDVQAPIGVIARVCAVDRPGLGGSGAPPAGLDAIGYIRLLRDLLRAANEPSPYVMVGHSLGGLVVQLFAVEYPDEVAGAVLVDSSHQDQIERYAVLPRRPSQVSPPTTRTEAVALEGFVAALQRTPRWRVGVPLIVLTRGRWTAGDDDADALARLEIWRTLQRDLVERSPAGEQVGATASGHYIHHDEPHLVVEAVRRVVAQAARP